MSQPQLRVKLVVAAGVVGASLLGATFVGCQSSQTSQAQSGPFGQYNGNQFAGNQYGGNQMAAGPNGQQGAPFAPASQMASAAGPANGLSPQGQQAFLNETQRLGTQQNLTAQDVVAMARSGVPDPQIALAIQQRGAALRTTPGASQYLSQSGVNPAVLGQPAGSNPGMSGAQVAMNGPQSGFPGSMNSARPAFNSPAASGVTSAAYPAAQGDAGQLQSATYDSSLATPALDGSAAAANGATNWRAMPH